MDTLNQTDNELLASVWAKFQEYVAAFELVEIKNSLKIAMEISSLCNKYMQEEKPWEEKNLKSGRSQVVLFVIANLIRLIGAIFEPFMPSFSAKIYYTLGLKRTENDERYIEYLLEANDQNILVKLLPSGQVLNKPVPLFAESKLTIFKKI